LSQENLARSVVGILACLWSDLSLRSSFPHLFHIAFRGDPVCISFDLRDTAPTNSSNKESDNKTFIEAQATFMLLLRTYIRSGSFLFVFCFRARLAATLITGLVVLAEFGHWALSPSTLATGTIPWSFARSAKLVGQVGHSGNRWPCPWSPCHMASPKISATLSPVPPLAELFEIVQ
jgi:hypothetical protein